MRDRTLMTVLVVASLMLIPTVSLAQDQRPAQGQGQGGDRGDGGGRRNFDPAEARQRMAGWVKEQLGASDEEWQVLQPKVEKIMNAQRDARGGFGFGGMGRRGGGGFGGGGGGDRSADQPQSNVEKARNDLRNTLQNKDAAANEIADKLKALREAREKAQQDLQSAQKELKDVLTPRQEAVLVSMGILE